MADKQPSQYQLFPRRRSVAQSNVEALVSALWWDFFPRKHFGPNHRLDHVFTRLSQHPEQATLLLCPYFFDQVTDRLPYRNQAKHKESCNLQLRCFDSWADEKLERRRRAEEREQRRLTKGIYLSRLCDLQDTGRSISTKEYIYQMYGYR